MPGMPDIANMWSKERFSSITTKMCVTRSRGAIFFIAFVVVPSASLIVNSLVLTANVSVLSLS